MKECDTLLMLGTDFPYRQFYPDGRARSRRSTCGRRRWATAARSQLGLLGDVKETLAALLPRLAEKTDTAFLDEAARALPAVAPEARRRRPRAARTARSSIRNT